MSASTTQHNYVSVQGLFFRDKLVLPWLCEAYGLTHFLAVNIDNN